MPNDPTLETEDPEILEAETGECRAMEEPAAGLTLWEFFSEAFVPLSGLAIPMKPFHKEICDAIEDALMGNLGYEFLVINVAPRVGKTKICEAAILWMLGMLADSQFIYTVYSASMAIETSRYCQGILQSEWYRQLFPQTVLGNVQKAEHFKTTVGGQVYADGTDGSLLGRGGGMKGRPGGAIFIDDASKPSEAQSQIEIEKLHRWFEGTIKNRRNSSDWCPIIVVQQRMGPEDLSGYLLANYPERTKHLMFPARVNGESTIPETVSTESLADTERNNPFAFASMYQQCPIILGGNMLKVEWFDYYDPAELDVMQFDFRIITSDMAWKTKEANDWSVFQLWGKLGAKIYLIDMARGKWESPQMMAVARSFWDGHKANDERSGWLRKLIVEDHAVGTAAIQELQREGVPVEAILRTKDKVARLEDVLPLVATRRVVLPRKAPWLTVLLNECAAFRKDGNHKHDDCVDPLTDACKTMLGESVSCFDVMRPAGDPGIPKWLRDRR